MHSDGGRVRRACNPTKAHLPRRRLPPFAAAAAGAAALLPFRLPPPAAAAAPRPAAAAAAPAPAPLLLGPGASKSLSLKSSSSAGTGDSWVSTEGNSKSSKRTPMHAMQRGACGFNTRHTRASQHVICKPAAAIIPQDSKAMLHPKRQAFPARRRTSAGAALLRPLLLAAAVVLHVPLLVGVKPQVPLLQVLYLLLILLHVKLLQR